ncbi:MULTISPECIES: DUF4431 domain-containing protein [Stenotrophomonas]|uniref:DUF4431 domain-containing protein n=1 Tax=Stenotrophomonas maltophilia TaxID=40324 RepID=A0A431UE19_STEMA|nr:DUF4431 domain-containing protein [Stenotrophomonas maltophilia]
MAPRIQRGTPQGRHRRHDTGRLRQTSGQHRYHQPRTLNPTTTHGGGGRRPAIKLFTPISVQAQDEYPPYAGGVLLIQLNLSGDLMRKYQLLKGKRVNMTGTLYHSHTGRHQTPVLITATGIAESE